MTGEYKKLILSVIQQIFIEHYYVPSIPEGAGNKLPILSYLDPREKGSDEHVNR